MKDFFDEINRLLDRFLTPAVKMILIINVAVTVFLIVVGAVMPKLLNDAVEYLGQEPDLSVKHFMIWQFLTYMFLHVEVMHLFWNMFALWMFGPPVENQLGTRRFWEFYLTAGVGAGLFHAIITVLFRHSEIGMPVVGASGALYGVLLAYGAFFPEQPIYIWGVFPMKAKHLIMLSVFMTFLFSTSGSQSNISHLTHLTGLVAAYLFLAFRHKTMDIRRWRYARRW